MQKNFVQKILMILISGMLVLNIESSKDKKSTTATEDKQTNDSQKPHSRHNSDEALAGNDDKKQKVEEFSLNFSITGNDPSKGLLSQLPMTKFSILIQEIRGTMHRHNHFAERINLNAVKKQAKNELRKRSTLEKTIIKTQEDNTILSLGELIDAVCNSGTCYISFQKNNHLTIDILVNTDNIKEKNLLTIKYDRESIESSEEKGLEKTKLSEKECLILKIVLHLIKTGKKSNEYRLASIYPYIYQTENLPTEPRESDTPYEFSFLPAKIKTEKCISPLDFYKTGFNLIRSNRSLLIGHLHSKFNDLPNHFRTYPPSFFSKSQ